MYAKFFKRFFDFVLSFMALSVLFPIILTPPLATRQPIESGNSFRLASRSTSLEREADKVIFNLFPFL